MTTELRRGEELEAGGLGVTRWPGGAATVVALPGLTSTSAAFSHLAGQLPDWTVFSPDLRGRGRSIDRPGPPGLAGHADDVAWMLEELDLRDVVLVGHSMGAYLAPVVEARAGDRVRAIVMIDGGIPPGFPSLMRPWMAKWQFSRQLKSADKDWPSIDAFAAHAKFDQMVASRPDLRETVLTMAAAEMVGGNGRFRPAVKPDIAIGDAVDTFFGPQAIAASRVPIRALLAENRRKDGEGPFISDKSVATWTAKLPNLQVTRLRGNHLTVLFAPEVVDAVTTI